MVSFFFTRCHIMFVHIPWKNSFFKLRPHQVHEIEEDAKGLFLRIPNAETNRRNKCRVYASHGSPKKSARKSPKNSPITSAQNAQSKFSLEHLVGNKVTGVVAQTGPNFVALLVDDIEGISSCSMNTTLVKTARRYLKDRQVPWEVSTPRSWTIAVSASRDLGPHVSLSSWHFKDLHKRFTLTITGVMHWEHNSRWVALKLKGPLVDHTDWILHLSCAQQVL